VIFHEELFAVVFASLAIIQMMTVSASEHCTAHENFSLVLHGGSLTVVENKDKQIALIMRVLDDGRRRLRDGQRAIDVVEATIRQLEDSALFNAGRSADANAGGFVETDASIMDGRTRAAGAIASMRNIRNPIAAARLVMDKSPHVLMVGDRGEAYAKGLGAEAAPDSYFTNNGRILKSKSPTGTVGAVAMDRCGNLASGTSTGGFGAKIPGRVGDSPIIGAGAYAENGVAAISSTGHGESFIRFTVAADLAARVKYLKQSLDQSAQAALEVLDESGAEGGIIGVDATGNVVMRFNRAGMIRGHTTENKAPIALAY
jgi:beta-aspartyl-peptidase (threonine type)